MWTAVTKSVAIDYIDSIDIQENAESLSQAMDNVEKTIIRSVLEKNQWQKSKTATILNVNRKTLFRKMKKYDLI